MSIANGYHTAGNAAIAEDLPVVLVRYRRGYVGETARTVHVVPLPADKQAGVTSALCGAVLRLDDIETVTPGEGMPCTVCVIRRITNATVAEKPPGSGPDSGDTVGLAADGATCQEWGWPVTLHKDQVHLSLEHHVSAVAIPAPLCAEVLTILTRRRCTPPVLAHPYAPEHHIVLTGEQYGLPLPWPAQVHQITGVLLLPPTLTPRGSITWVRAPQPDSLRLCREIDLFAALRDAGPR